VAKARGGGGKERGGTGRRSGARKGPPGGGRRKSCPYCRAKVDIIDYKDSGQLRRGVSDKGKIKSSRVTGACRRHQGQLATAVKRARELGFLPYVSDR
jgi:small subunit ribosomal protein S18